MKRAFLLITLCSFSYNALASTFCIAGPGLPPQCIYDDIRSCAKEAKPPNTICVANPDAYLSYIGGARYCSLGSERVAQCLYSDRAQCNSEAQRAKGICIDRQSMLEDVGPYHYDNRLQN